VYEKALLYKQAPSISLPSLKQKQTLLSKCVELITNYQSQKESNEPADLATPETKVRLYKY